MRPPHESWNLGYCRGGSVCKIQSWCVPHCSCRPHAGMWYVLAGAGHVSGSSSGGQVLQACRMRLWEAGIGANFCSQVAVILAPRWCQRCSVCGPLHRFIFPVQFLLGCFASLSPLLAALGITAFISLVFVFFQVRALPAATYSSIGVLLRCTRSGAGLASYTQMLFGDCALCLGLLASL